MTARKPKVSLGANPYVAGPPVYGEGPFFGRAEQLSRLSDFVRGQGRLLVVLGGRRVGKTSLLRQLSVTLVDPIVPLFLQLPPSAEGRQAALVELYSLVGAEPPAAEAPLEDVVAAFARQVRSRHKKKQPVLLLDSVPEGADEALIRALLALTVGRSHLPVVVTLGPDRAPLGELPTGAQSVALGPLSDEEARALVEKPLEGMLPVEEEAILNLLDLTGGHPALLQSLCYETFELVRARPVETISMKEVVLASRRIDAEPTALAWVWDGLGADEQLVLSAIAEAAPIDRSIFVSEVADVLESFQVSLKGEALEARVAALVDHGLLERDAPNRIAFSVELLRRWITRHHPVEGMSQVRLDGTGSRNLAMRHLQLARDAHVLQNLPRAIDSYRKALEADAGFTEARMGLGRALAEAGRFQEATAVLKEAQSAAPEEAREELTEAYLSWIDHLRAQNQPIDEVLSRALAVSPGHPELLAILRSQRTVEVQALLRLGKHKELIERIDQCVLEADAEGLQNLKEPLQAHLDKLLAARDGKAGRWVPPYIEVLLRAYPQDPTPLVKYAEALLSEAEAAEPKSPPTAQSFYRKAERILERLPAELPALVALKDRLAAGRARCDELVVREKELALDRLVEQGQAEAAEKLAQEMLAERESPAAQQVLDRIRSSRSAPAAPAAAQPVAPAPAAAPAPAPASAVEPARVGVAPLPPAAEPPAVDRPREEAAGHEPPQDLPAPAPRPSRRLPEATAAALPPFTDEGVPYPHAPPPRRFNPLWAVVVVLVLAVVLLLSDRARDAERVKDEPPPDRLASSVEAPAPAPAEGQVEAQPTGAPVVIAPLPEGAEAPAAAEAQGTVAPTAAAATQAPEVPADARAAAEEAAVAGRQAAARGAFQTAMSEYQKSLTLNPSQPGILQELALIYYMLKRYPEAEDALEKALDMSPELSLVRFDLAKAYRAQGKSADARAAFEKALQDPRLPGALAEEARAYIASVERGEAQPVAPAPAPEAAPQPAAGKEGGPAPSLWGEGNSGAAPIQLFGSEGAPAPAEPARSP